MLFMAEIGKRWNATQLLCTVTTGKCYDCALFQQDNNHEKKKLHSLCTLNILCGLNYVLTNLCVFFPVFSLQVSKNFLERNFNGWGKILVLLKRFVHYRYTSTLRRILPSSMEGGGRPITSIQPYINILTNTVN